MVYVNLLEGTWDGSISHPKLMIFVHKRTRQKKVIFVTYNSKHDITCVYGKKRRTKHTENM